MGLNLNSTCWCNTASCGCVRLLVHPFANLLLLLPSCLNMMS